jgi:putative hydrolase of the HAD superfamily
VPCRRDPAGLRAIAIKSGLDPDAFEKCGFDTIRETGYVLGRSDEETFWRVLKSKTGISGDPRDLREEILSRFRLRSWMLALLPALKEMGLIVGILSDQTQWLDELDAREGFFKGFDHVFNSYHLGRGKDDPAHFDDIAARLNLPPERILFVDDHDANIDRAGEKGFRTILYRDQEDFMRGLARFCPSLQLHTETE